MMRNYMPIWRRHLHFRKAQHFATSVRKHRRPDARYPVRADMNHVELSVDVAVRPIQVSFRADVHHDTLIMENVQLILMESLSYYRRSLSVSSGSL